MYLEGNKRIGKPSKEDFEDAGDAMYIVIFELNFFEAVGVLLELRLELLFFDFCTGNTIEALFKDAV